MTPSSIRATQSLWRSAEGSAAAARRPKAGEVRTPDPAARAAWFAVARERDEVQARIVRAVRQHLEDGGPGPSEFDLLLFARTAVREQRLARALAAMSPVLVARRR